MSNFFKRWSDLKNTQSQAPAVKPTKESEDPQVPEVSAVQTVDEMYQGPTLEDVKQLNPESDFSGFVAGDVKEEVHHAAMKKLFSDPHYNVMDGLDIYIDDYSKEDPMPPGMLEQLVQSSMLGIFKKPVEELATELGESTQPIAAPDLDINPISQAETLPSIEIKGTKDD
jgi:hypothetical protein